MKRILNKSINVIYFLFGIFILLPSEKRGVLVILLAFFSLLIFIKTPKIKITKPLIINSSLYILYVISTIWSFDTGDTPKRLETSLSLLVFPVMFSILYTSHKETFNKNKKLLFLKTYILSSFLFSLIVIGYFAYLGYFSGTKTYGYCLSLLSNKLPLLADHPIYLSILLSLSVLLSTEIYRTLSNKSKAFLLMSNIFVVLVILFLSRRGPIFALIISLLFCFKAFKIFSRKSALISLLTFVFIVVLSLFITPIKKRMFEIVDVKSYTQKNETNSTSNRIQIYKCAIQLIKEKPILGYGVGKDRQMLYNCYKDNLYYLYENRFNTHNQYLSITIKLGLIGILVFLFSLFYNLRLANLANDSLFLAIIIFFIINMLFENILERQNGVIIFCFLINYFAFKNHEIVQLKTKK